MVQNEKEEIPLQEKERGTRRRARRKQVIQRAVFEVYRLLSLAISHLWLLITGSMFGWIF